MAKYDPADHPCAECDEPIYGVESSTWAAPDREVHTRCQED
jgi:hypothetical protein